MIAALIGISAGLFTILIAALFKRADKNLFYGLVLACIGFLYIGYSWTDIADVIMNILQAMFFLLLAYIGVKKNPNFLIAGYFIHGLWDFIYSHVGNAELLPPHYDLFCSTYDFIIGFYLLRLKYQKIR